MTHDLDAERARINRRLAALRAEMARLKAAEDDMIAERDRIVALMWPMPKRDKGEESE